MNSTHNACNERRQVFMTDGLKVISTFRFSPTSQHVLQEAAQAQIDPIIRGRFALALSCSFVVQP